MAQKISGELHEMGSNYLKYLTRFLYDYRNGKETEETLRYVEKYREELKKFKKELVNKDPAMDFLISCVDEFLELSTPQNGKKPFFKTFKEFRRADEKNPIPVWHYMREYTYRVSGNYNFHPHTAWAA